MRTIAWSKQNLAPSYCVPFGMRAAVVYLVAGLAACGGAAPLPATVANAEAGIRAAREVGAATDPQGALHLSLAQEELEKAKKEYGDGNAKAADLTLAKAQADADLALAEAREAQSRAQVQQAQDQIKLVKAQH